MKIAVVGDVMLDEWVKGTVSRISPEAPVLILNRTLKNDVYNLGGAGNVAANLTNLGVEVDLYGVIGEDKTAESVISICKDSNINYKFFTSSNKVTPLKTRFISDNKHILRLDNESIEYIEGTNEYILSHFEYDYYDAIIISDYGKGVVTSTICNNIISNNKYVYVDPYGTNWKKYKNAYCIKSNEKEFKSLNMEPEYLINVLNIKNLVVTLGSKGSVWYNNTGFEIEEFNISVSERNIYDVCGAGDTFISVLTYYNSIAFYDALRYANDAASISVEKEGVTLVSLKDLFIPN